MKKINSYQSIMNKEIGIRVNGNESFKNVDERDLNEVVDIVKKLNFNRYPDNDCKRLRQSYATVIGVESDNIIAGNGSDEMLSLIIGALIGRRKTVLTLAPDFTMYDFYTSVNDGRIKKYKTEDDGSFSINKFISYGLKLSPKLIIFSNPNNPTGHVMTEEEIIYVLEAFPEATVVVDEAYYEFYGHSMIQYIDKYKNLIVTRTLSKAWGLAAFRVGFLIANKETIKELELNKVPYNLNQFSQEVACCILMHPERILQNVQEIVYERERLYKMLKEVSMKTGLSTKFYSSKANFIYGRSIHKDKIKAALEKQGILIRYFEDDSFRISIGSPLENDLVANTIKLALDFEEEKKNARKKGAC